MFICDISIFNKYGKQMLDELLSPLNLCWRELVVILVIEQIPGVTQARLSPFLQTDKANVTKLLQAMQKKGLIKRETSEEDQRNKICHLTNKGNELTDQLHKILDLWEAACFQHIDKNDIIQFRRISEIVTQNLIK